jgi:ATP-dependent helicase/nuclease subunit B
VAQVAALRISAEPHRSAESAGPSWNSLAGGRRTLLEWLEQHLGLQTAQPSAPERATAYAQALARADGASYRDSFQADRYGTAAHLLELRDELRLAGWDGADRAGLPALVRDLAKAEGPGVPRGEAERVALVLAALDAGQLLPDHVVALEEPAAAWPPAWRPLLARLTTARAPDAAPNGSGALGDAQALLLGAESPLALDPTFRFAEARSRLAACQALAAMLAARPPEEWPRTTILCEDEDTALLLDRCLHRLGLPTMGATRRGAALPPFQVLPLVVAMCWEPVDPALLLQFLTLPDTPVGRTHAWRLAKALEEQPGLGSAAWDAARAAATAPEADPEGEAARRIAMWFDHERVRRGQPLPVRVVGERCAKVAHWAMGRAALAESQDPLLAAAFRIAASHATNLVALASAHGEAIHEPQLERLVDALGADGSTLAPVPAEAGGPRLARNMAEVGPCASLVWMGVSTQDPRPSPWTPAEVARLRAAGVDVDDGLRSLRLLRAAERRGLANVQERVLVLRLPKDAEARPHPLWQRLHLALPRQGDERPAAPVALEDALGSDALAPWVVAAREPALEEAQPKRPTWRVPADLLVLPSHSSATELEARLACPLKWTLRHPARLKDGTTAALPASIRLKGNLGHDLLARVLGGGVPLPTPEEAREAMGRAFDERLPKDAAPLAMPAAAGEAVRLRQELVDATEQLVTILRDGGYRVVAMEMPVEGALDGRPMCGAMDCLVATEGGEEAVLDFKYVLRKPRDKLRDSKALQLAVYAASREATTGRRVEGAGYFVLASGRLYTPQGSPVRGAPSSALERGAPSMTDTWHRFRAALAAAESWRSDGIVPARPLQDTKEWPRDGDLATDREDDKAKTIREPCKYCPYGGVCGKEERP